MLKIIFCIFSLLFLVYLLLPEPSSIADFSPLPNSVKSKLAGDTTQLPNVAAYFSNNYRPFVVNFYKNAYSEKTKFFLPPLKLNYPPEFAFTAIKDQTQSTYLEEYYYPLKGSIFVNGLEPFYEDGKPKFMGSTPFSADGKNYYTKVTLRYYPASLWSKLVTWAGLNISLVLLWKLSRRIIFNV